MSDIALIQCYLLRLGWAQRDGAKIVVTSDRVLVWCCAAFFVAYPDGQIPQHQRWNFLMTMLPDTALAALRRHLEALL